MQKVIAERGFMLAQEPAVGSGAMIIALTRPSLKRASIISSFSM
ncbi:hypothetical protein [Shinella sp. HZN7]|nr:hypothetical protein [Shinella sp. HZN7]